MFQGENGEDDGKLCNLSETVFSESIWFSLLLIGDKSSYVKETVCFTFFCKAFVCLFLVNSSLILLRCNYWWTTRNWFWLVACSIDCLKLVAGMVTLLGLFLKMRFFSFHLIFGCACMSIVCMLWGLCFCIPISVLLSFVLMCITPKYMKI